MTQMMVPPTARPILRIRAACWWVALLAGAAVLSPWQSVPAQQPAGNAGKIDFAHDVVPILKRHCVECHGGKESKGGFSLNTRELLLDAEAVAPGKPDESRLIELVSSDDPDQKMPPGDRPGVGARELATLRRWIAQQAPWEAGFSFAESRYEPPLRPRRPELPPAIDGRSHPVDRFVDAYFARQSVERPGVVGDAEFLRRVSLDVVGLLPTPERLEAFLSDPRSDKRERVIDELLSDRIAYAEHWLTFWNDLLRNDYTGTGFITGGRKQITGWLYRALVDNKPYDQFVRELIAPGPEAEGFIRGIRWRGNVNASQAQEIQFAQNITQAFLGINMKCASCHDSFIDRWTLEETYGLAQIYATSPLELHRCDKPTGKQAEAGWIFPELGDVQPAAPQPQRLRQLAELMTHEENGRFTRTIVNRIWHRLMGRGIVHPVDAMHTEPWDADLLDYLAAHLADAGYDLKQSITLICTSQIYQARTPPREAPSESGSFVFRGPLARRMTAEQFVDGVWQVTGAAPVQYDAQVLRVVEKDGAAKSASGKPDVQDGKSDGQQGTSDAQGGDKGRSGAASNLPWIWSRADAAAGEAVTLRKRFQLREVPSRAVAVITCDNEYVLYVNGQKLGADTNWETVEAYPLVPYLRPGANEILIAARNAGNGPNPAGLFFAARWQREEEQQPVVLAADETWQWTAARPDGRGRLRPEPEDWQAAAVLEHPAVWTSRVGSRIAALLQSMSAEPPRMVRASLVKNDAFMRSLGRPNRDQIVTMRPDELTTLEAIDLANGQSLADAIAQGAGRLAQQHAESRALVEWLFAAALSRSPTPEERQLALDLLGEVPEPRAVEDLLWALLMLPEFQLIR